MTTDSILTAALMAISNLGGLALLVRQYAGKVDGHDKVLPATLESLKTLSKAFEKTVESLDELYNSRNNHEVRLTEVETVHKMNGCDQPKKQVARRPKRG